jgi:uncharacterized protein
MIFRSMMLALAASLATAPALAADASAFTLQCQAKGGPAATCICMASELEKTTDGSVVLDSYGIADMPEADRNAAKTAMMERYKLTPEDMGRIGNEIPTLLETARKACDTE